MRRWSWWLFTGSLTLRLISIAASLLWYDEAFTALISGLPLPRMLAAISGDVHPPLWYAIEWAISHTIGPSTFALRVPAALFGAGSTVLLYQLVKNMTGENEGRWASGLMAVMPGQLYYSQEARMYSLLTFLVLLGANAIRDHKWVRAGLSLALILFTQNLGALYAATLGGWALWESRGRAFKPLALIGLAYLPQAAIAIKQFQTVDRGFWVPPSGNFGGALYYIFFTTFFVRMPEYLQMHAIALALILTFTALFMLRGKLRQLSPLIVVAFGPALLLYLISLVWKPVLLDRALLPSGAAITGLWGVGLSMLPKWGKIRTAAVAVPMFLAVLVTYYTDPIHQRQTSDPMVEIINAEWQPGDVVYHTHLTSLISFDWYMPDRPAYILPESGDLAQSLSEPTKQAMGISEREYLPQTLRFMGYRRLWLIYGSTVVSSELELKSQELFIDTYPVIQQWPIFHNKLETIRLYLLELRPSEAGG